MATAALTLPRELLRAADRGIPAPARRRHGGVRAHARRALRRRRAAPSMPCPRCRWTTPTASRSGCSTSSQHEGETVLIAPGNGFYATPGLGPAEARIAYVFEEAALRRALRRARRRGCGSIRASSGRYRRGGTPDARRPRRLSRAAQQARETAAAARAVSPRRDEEPRGTLQSEPRGSAVASRPSRTSRRTEHQGQGGQPQARLHQLLDRLGAADLHRHAQAHAVRREEPLDLAAGHRVGLVADPGLGSQLRRRGTALRRPADGPAGATTTSGSRKSAIASIPGSATGRVPRASSICPAASRRDERRRPFDVHDQIAPRVLRAEPAQDRGQVVDRHQVGGAEAERSGERPAPRSTSARSRRTSSRSRPARARRRSPGRRRRHPAPERRRSGSPTARSSCRSRALTAGWVRKSLRAAAERLPSSRPRRPGSPDRSDACARYKPAS